LVMTVPGASDGATATRSVKVATPPGSMNAVLQLTVPAAKIPGVEQNHPDGVEIPRNDVPAGRTSVSVTGVAVLGPAFVTVMV